MHNVIPFLGRRRKPPAGSAPTAPSAGRSVPVTLSAVTPPPPAARTALAACMAPPQLGERYHIAPVWNGAYVAGFSLWDAGRDGITPRRLRTWMVADLGRHRAAGLAHSLRVAMNAEWAIAAAGLTRSQAAGRELARPWPSPAPETAP